MDREKLRRQFERRRTNYNRLNLAVQQILSSQLARREVPVSEVTGRIKSFDSLYQKVERKGYTHPFEEVHDICGVRVVCLVLSDLEVLEEVIESAFVVTQLDQKVKNKADFEFGYLSNHYVVQLREPPSNASHNAMLSLSCEIQTRTLAMDTWAKISHFLDYKQAEDIPKSLRRDFFALSGLLYVADVHFDRLNEERDRNKSEVAMMTENELQLANVDLDLDSLTAFLNAYYPNVPPASTIYYSELLADLLEGGYQTLSHLRMALSEGSTGGQDDSKLDPFALHMGAPGLVRERLKLHRHEEEAQ
jgi:putative GTP pyrophosphokinase